MIKVLLFDLTHVLLFPADKKSEVLLNDTYKKISTTEGFEFFDHFILNQELINFIESQKEKYQIILYTTETIQEDPKLAPIILGLFKKVIAGAKLKLHKNEANSYQLIANNLRVDHSEILYIDDIQENITAAKEAGLSAIQYKNTKQFLADFKKIS